MTAEGAFVLAGVRIWHGKVSIPVRDAVAAAAILSRALDSDVLDETIRLLLATPDPPSPPDLDDDPLWPDERNLDLDERWSS